MGLMKLVVRGARQHNLNNINIEIPPNTLTFHFDRLRGSGLVTVRREGRSMIYAAQFDTMNALLAFLTENCCGGVPCTPAAECKPARKRVKVSA